MAWRQVNFDRIKQLRERKADFCTRYKLSAGCFDCAYSKCPEALQFDHVSGPKLGNISQILDRSFKYILTEIEKCVVRCANCHAVTTKQRRVNGQKIR